jgi:hypothetical protein
MALVLVGVVWVPNIAEKPAHWPCRGKKMTEQEKECAKKIDEMCFFSFIFVGNLRKKGKGHDT